MLILGKNANLDRRQRVNLSNFILLPYSVLGNLELDPPPRTPWKKAIFGGFFEGFAKLRQKKGYFRATSENRPEIKGIFSSFCKKKPLFYSYIWERGFRLPQNFPRKKRDFRAGVGRRIGL